MGRLVTPGGITGGVLARVTGVVVDGAAHLPSLEDGIIFGWQHLPIPDAGIPGHRAWCTDLERLTFKNDTSTSERTATAL